MTKRKTEAEPAAEATEVRAAAAAESENSDDAVTAPAAAENNTAIKRIYVGVSVPGCKSGTAFTGDIPKKLDIPFVRDLFVTEDKFTAFLKKKAVTGSYEAFCYRKSAELAKSLKR